MIGLDAVVAVLVGHMRCRWDQFVQHPRVRTSLIGGDLHRCWAVGQRAGEEPAGGGGVPLLGQQHVDDLPVLVDRPVQVPPPAGTLT